MKHLLFFLPKRAVFMAAEGPKKSNEVVMPVDKVEASPEFRREQADKMLKEYAKERAAFLQRMDKYIADNAEDPEKVATAQKYKTDIEAHTMDPEVMNHMRDLKPEDVKKNLAAFRNILGELPATDEKVVQWLEARKQEALKVSLAKYEKYRAQKMAEISRYIVGADGNVDLRDALTLALYDFDTLPKNVQTSEVGDSAGVQRLVAGVDGMLVKHSKLLKEGEQTYKTNVVEKQHRMVGYAVSRAVQRDLEKSGGNPAALCNAVKRELSYADTLKTLELAPDGSPWKIEHEGLTFVVTKKSYADFDVRLLAASPEMKKKYSALNQLSEKKKA